MKRIAKIILLLILIVHVLPGIQIILNNMGTSLYPKTYISTLNVPEYQTEIEDLFENINDFGHTLGFSDFIRYEGIRPIFINSTNLYPKITNIWGLAYPHPLYCNILVHNGLTVEQTKATILHEYFHCWGFDHVEDPCDIMYHESNVCEASIFNILEYFIKIWQQYQRRK